MQAKLQETEGYKVYEQYKTSVINLYSIFCEMTGKGVEDITINEKAAELDDYYRQKEKENPAKYNDFRKLIIKEYKQFNPEYEKVLYKSGKPTRRFTQEFVESELAKEGCKLISKYKNGDEPIYYMYNGKRYYVKFSKWRHHGYRPHLGLYPEAHLWD